MNRAPWSEPIETINAEVVAAFSSEDEADAKARDYFFSTLGLSNNKQIDYHGYFWSTENGGGDTSTFDEEFFVEYITLENGVSESSVGEESDY